MDRLRLFRSSATVLTAAADAAGPRRRALGGRGDAGPAPLPWAADGEPAAAGHGDVPRPRRSRRSPAGGGAGRSRPPLRGVRPVLLAAAHARRCGSAGRGRRLGLDADLLFTSTPGNAFFVTELLAFGESSLPPRFAMPYWRGFPDCRPTRRRCWLRLPFSGQPAELALLAAVSGSPRPRSMSASPRACWWGTAAAGTSGMRLLGSRSPSPCCPRHVPATRCGPSVPADAGDGDDRRMAFHAAGCGDHGAVRRHGPRAAERAARLGAHRESAEHYRLASLATRPTDPRASCAPRSPTSAT